MSGYQIRPIGYVESMLEDVGDAPKQGAEGNWHAWLHIDEVVREGLKDLQVGQRVLLFTWLHEADRTVLAVHPRDDESNPLTGVFSTRSADRPNPVGLHPVEILSIDGSTLGVAPLEAVNGTPIVDIKPEL